MIVEQLVEWRLAGETEVLGENLPQRYFVHHKIPHDQTRARTPDRRGGKPATNRLSYGAANRLIYLCVSSAQRAHVTRLCSKYFETSYTVFLSGELMLEKRHWGLQNRLDKLEPFNLVHHIPDAT
jgi:hypothetical protein